MPFKPMRFRRVVHKFRSQDSLPNENVSRVNKESFKGLSQYPSFSTFKVICDELMEDFKAIKQENFHQMLGQMFVFAILSF